MAKTALDLTVEQLRMYRPERELDEGSPSQRRERAWQVAHAAARLLREDFGATRVVVFGSLAHRAWFSAWSDIDLVAWGIPVDQFYKAVAVVTGLSSDFEVDLIDPDVCRPTMRESIEREGVEL